MDRKSPSRGPLDGVRIVEMEALGPVPFAGMLFADMGAEIVVLAPPAGARDTKAAQARPDHLRDPVRRGRARLELNLKDPDGVCTALAIIATADILIEGFRPGVMERLGLGPADVLAANPRLVFGRMTGWGQHGPLAQAAGHDANYLAISGALGAFGYPDRPPLTPLNLAADLGGGALYLTTGVLAALIHARATGEGQVVDAAMTDGVTSMLSYVHGLRGLGLWQDRRFANTFDGGSPTGTTYETADGQYVVLAAAEEKFYRVFLERISLSEADLPDRRERANWPALRERLATLFRTRTRDEWAALFDGVDACVSPVLSLAEAPHHLHNIARETFVDWHGHPQPAPAPRFDATPTDHAPDDLGDPWALVQRWGAAVRED